MPHVFTEGHARAVLQVAGETERITLKNQIIAQKLSVREAEELARGYNQSSLGLAPDQRGGRIRQQSYDTRQLQEEFMRAIEMKVKLQRSTKGKGSLTLYFTNEDQLQRLYERLVGQDDGDTLDALSSGSSGNDHAFDTLLGNAYVHVDGSGSDNN